MKARTIQYCRSITLSCTDLPIKALHVNAFISPNCNYNSIQYLYLNNNNITELHIYQFIKLTNLTQIYLNYNKIQLVNRLLFLKNIKLTHINLSYNRIIKFVLDIVTLPSLEYLNLGYNYITRLNHSIFKKYIKKGNNQYMKTLLLYNNSFDCVCDIMWLSNLGKLDIINIKHLDTDLCIKCLLNKACTGVGIFNKKKCDTG